MAERTRELIDGFLAQKRLAIVGVSRNPQDLSRALFREFLKQGYDIIPVNPNTTEVEGRKCFARVGDITPGVESALLMTPSVESARLLREAIEAGVRRVWLYRAMGKGATHQEAVDLCREKGVDLIEGYCPFMFFPSSFVHRIHAFCSKLLGSYPAAVHQQAAKSS